MKKSSTFCSFKFRKFRARRKILGSVRLAVWKKVFLIMMMCLAGSGLSLPLAADEFKLDLPSGLERSGLDRIFLPVILRTGRLKTVVFTVLPRPSIAMFIF